MPAETNDNGKVGPTEEQVPPVSQVFSQGAPAAQASPMIGVPEYALSEPEDEVEDDEAEAKAIGGTEPVEDNGFEVFERDRAQHAQHAPGQGRDWHATTYFQYCINIANELALPYELASLQ